MRARVEETSALQLRERERLLHAPHDTSVGAAREVCETGAARGLCIYAAACEVVDAFGLLFAATGLQELFADGRDARARERFWFGRGLVGWVGRGALRGR